MLLLQCRSDSLVPINSVCSEGYRRYDIYDWNDLGTRKRMGPEAIHHGCVGNDICITQFNQYDAMKYRVSCTGYRVPVAQQQS
jgi:hypothetical protein